MSNTDPVIAFNAVTLTWPDGRTILRNFNLHVHRQEKVVLYGPSGSGKSSLLKILLGFVRPQSGEVRINGQLLDHSNVWTMRRRFSYVSQSVDWGALTAAEWIEQILAFKANAEVAVTPEKRRYFAERLRLSEGLLEKPQRELSGGERQRVGILLALVLDRTIFLLDEPTASLDQDLKKDVADLFLGAPDYTVLCASHDTPWLREEVKKIDLRKSNEHA